MKKPDIGKRILPLLDIVFILLAFFIVLPHGVKSNEMVRIGMLEKQKNELQQELEYFRWKHGTNKTLSNKIHRILHLAFKNNKILIGKDKIPLSDEDWTQLLDKKIELAEATFIIFKVEKDDEGFTTLTKSVDDLKNFLQQKSIVYIEEDSGDDDWQKGNTMSKKKKKKFLTKKKMAAGAIVAALVYFAPRGGDFLKFLPVITSESAQETEKNPQQDKQKQEDSSLKNEKPKDDSQQQAMEEITLRMRFIDGKLYVGNWPCPDKETLDKTIQKILTQYANKEVRIKYYRDGNDPYKASYSAQKLLKEAGFHVTVHRGDAE